MQWSKEGRNGVVAREQLPENVMTGSSALRQERTGGGYFGFYQSFNLQPGSWYRIEYWSKATVPGTSVPLPSVMVMVDGKSVSSSNTSSTRARHRS